MLFPVSLVWSSGAFVASPHPDVPLFPLGVLSAALVLSMLRGDERLRTSLTGLTMLVALGISIKLSFAAFGLTALAIGIVATWKRLNTPERIRALIAPALLAFAIGGPWIARGYILSGYPAYPSTVLRSSADWRVPEELAAREVAVIRAMARDGKRPWQEVARDPHWMSVWFPRTVRRVFEVTLPLGLFVLGLIVFFAARRHGGDARRMLWVLAPPGVALVAWFFMAPDPRFAGASFWILGAGATALAITALNEKFTRRAALAALVLALVIFALDYPNQGTHRGPHSLPQPEIAQTALTDGTAVTVPPDGLCWDGPLLCTPEADPGLRLRKSGDISAGFQITRAF
ncbi:MAG: hypothetical protein M5R36_04975 [Deltaproteobacteria bacterium]|nr:hypothetical protein [Deltaproteobacteria bacterium]